MKYNSLETDLLLNMTKQQKNDKTLSLVSKINKMNKILFLVVLIATSCTGGLRTSDVTPYPMLEGAKESTTFAVEVNGQKIWTEHYTSNLKVDEMPNWFSDPYVLEPQEMHIASFEGDGLLEFNITVEGAPVNGTLLNPQNVVVKPLSKGVEAQVEGDKISFNQVGSGQLVVEVEGLPPLFIFANGKEEWTPAKDEADVIYFGPGVHEAGYIEMKDNQTVYLAAGALVYGGIRAKDVSNIKVLGRGVLDGDYRYSQMVLIEECNDILFKDVTIRNSMHWTNTLVNCRDVEYSNVKVIGFGPSSDGINPMNSQRVRITDSFIRCTDDCVAIKAMDPNHPVEQILVENSIMIGYAYADGVTIGFETNAEYVRDVTVRNCDILLARGGSRVDGHSGFSIICDGPARISNILFEDIRVEKSELKLFELHITDGTEYGYGPPGHINDITLRNIDWLHEGPIVIYGYDDNHLVQNVQFENCRVAGIPLDMIQEDVMQLNDYVENISIE